MDFQDVLESIHAELASLPVQGKVASYIPVLAQINPGKLGLALTTVEGDTCAVGDAEETFSIQSISKAFTLTLALRQIGENIFQRVGIEPSGTPFNSLVQLEYEQGIPRNPFINAGAMVIVDMLKDHIDDLPAELTGFVGRLMCDDAVSYDRIVVASERDHGYRNVALVNFMKSFGNIRHETASVLDAYYHQCSIAMSCVQLSRAFLFLANGGVVPGSGESILTTSQCKRLNAILLTCGVYDEAGEFAYRVGMPAKSGVGGGIVAVMPGKFSLAVWSPGLNTHGNSAKGVDALEMFTSKTKISIF